jgi:hypothetical protein
MAASKAPVEAVFSKDKISALRPSSDVNSRGGTGGGNTRHYLPGKAQPTAKRLLRNGLEAIEPELDPENYRLKSSSLHDSKEKVKQKKGEVDQDNPPVEDGLLNVGQVLDYDSELLKTVRLVPSREELNLILKDLRSKYAKCRQAAVERIGVIGKDNFDIPEFRVTRRL